MTKLNEQGRVKLRPELTGDQKKKVVAAIRKAQQGLRPMTEKKLLVVQVQVEKLEGHQRQQIYSAIRKQLPDYNILVTDLQFLVSDPAPYQHTERLGDHSTTVGFPDKTSMRRYVEKQKPGLWYDWSAGESNDDNWNAMQGGRIRAYDAADERIGRILFYHSGTHHLERVAVNKDDELVAVREAGALAVIVETRELRFEFDGCQSLPSNPDATVPIQDDLTTDDETWRDRPSML